MWFRRSLLLGTVLPLVLLLSGALPPTIRAGSPLQGLPYPPTRTDNVVDTYWGTQVRDPYRWLEDESAGEVQTWMKAEDTLARQELGRLAGRAGLRKRFKALYNVDSVGLPVPAGDALYYLRRPAGVDKAILYGVGAASGNEAVVLDPNAASFGLTNTLGSWTPSNAGYKLAYVVHPNNGDEGVMHVLDVASGVTSAVDVLQGADFTDAQWLPDGTGFYYQYFPHDPTIPDAERQGFADIRLHLLGTPQSADSIAYPHTGNPNLWLSPTLSYDGRWLFAYIFLGWSGVEIRYRDLQKADSTFQTLFKADDASASVIAWQGYFYIWTNEGAPNGRLYRAAIDQLARDQWQLIVPERNDAVLESYSVINGRLVLQYLQNASHSLKVVMPDGQPAFDVPLPALGSIGGVSGQPDRAEMFFLFSSFTYPRQIYRGTVNGPDKTLWAQVNTPVQPDRFEVRQVWYTSRDGTKVSMFLVGDKEALRIGAGPHPLLLYGYGGFAVNILPEFDTSIFPWLEAGGLYAVPNLRGGAEYGEDWHRGGMLLKKQNVFDDFIAAAEYLIAQGFTTPGQLAISGASNGGLLVAAALTQRPDLFKAVSCGVPLTDMLRYQKFGLGSNWVPEYGSVDDEAQFKALNAYSPYHRVKAGTHYPAVLFLSADHDDRVDPLHARKMAAALQAANPTGAPVLLRIEQSAGHGGGTTLSARIEEFVDEYAFLMDQVALVPPLPRPAIYLPALFKRWPPVPEKPSGFQVTDDGAGFSNYLLRWQPEDTATRYVIEQSRSASFADAQTITASGTQTYRQVRPGRYFFRLRAENEWGAGPWSEPVQFDAPALFLNLHLQWNERDEVRGTQNVDIGIHVERQVNAIPSAQMAQLMNTVSYYPNPYNWSADTWVTSYDRDSLTVVDSTAQGSGFSKWGYPWIMPRSVTMQPGQIAWVFGQAFDVGGPQNYTAGSNVAAIPAWALTNREEIVTYDEPKVVQIRIPRGGLVIWYATDETRLLLSSTEHLAYYQKGKRIGINETLYGTLDSANVYQIPVDGTSTAATLRISTGPAQAGQPQGFAPNVRRLPSPLFRSNPPTAGWTAGWDPRMYPGTALSRR